MFTYAFAPEVLQPFLPLPLQLDLHQDNTAFLAIALVDTRNLRPAGFPKIFGLNFILAGYRIFVRYKTSEGKNLRGLYILKSGH